MFDENNDDRCWEEAGEHADEISVDLGYRGMLESSGHWAQDGERREGCRIAAAIRQIQIHHGADEGVEENDEDRAQGVTEEPDFAALRLLAGQVVECKADDVEHGQSGDAHRSIGIGLGKILQRTDHDVV